MWRYAAYNTKLGNGATLDDLLLNGTTYDKMLASVCKELYIPKGVESIKDGIFKTYTESGGGTAIAVNSEGLTEIDVTYVKDADGNPVLDTNGRVQVDPANSDFAGCAKLTALTLSGQNTLTIPDYAFYNCDQMSYVYSTQPVDSIGTEAFAECNILGNVEMYGVKSIGDHALPMTML